MDSAAQEFRNSCLDTLNFISPVYRQREFAAKVEYSDYKSEFVCWWFDDLVMESLPNGTRLISESFNASEKSILWEFTKLFEQNLNDEELSIDGLLNDPQWMQIMKLAKDTLNKVGKVS
ncbi:hypothetical protein [Thalassotalea sp. Y01]|uniref:hypothetical protein n=1 Tax=Thalassotalea sp. Y01 TaxID=2729613 RepID=UPI00145F87D7|nr:hypothetical protein [Thalassotalea sp. Y01]NMP15895.1 hypothetical protein [Thalassotalea sp. Y01]